MKDIKFLSLLYLLCMSLNIQAHENNANQNARLTLKEYVSIFTLFYNEVMGEGGMAQNFSVTETRARLNSKSFSVDYFEDNHGNPCIRAARNCTLNSNYDIASFYSGVSCVISLWGQSVSCDINVYSLEEYKRLYKEADAMCYGHRIVNDYGQLYSRYITKNRKTEIRFYTFKDRTLKQGKYLVSIREYID